MKATFLGHATVYLETDKTKILIDPFLTGNPKAGAKADDLEPDFIVLTHGHSDHIADALPIAKRTGATIISTFELASWLGTQGAKVVAPESRWLVQISVRRRQIHPSDPQLIGNG